jgi:hypothetical protein
VTALTEGVYVGRVSTQRVILRVLRVRVLLVSRRLTGIGPFRDVSLAFSLALGVSHSPGSARMSRMGCGRHDDGAQAVRRDGHTYLTRQVASADERRPAGQALADYYTVRGNPSGVWMVSGSATLGQSGTEVSEA